MYRLEFKLNRRPNMIQRFAALVLAGAALVGVFFLGLFVLSLALGAGLIIAVVISFRRWRAQSLNQQQASARARTHTAGRSNQSSDVLEASYTVVRRNRRE